jgi:ATP-binding cassette, subfamily G (WHITE), member 2, SNQ2
MVLGILFYHLAFPSHIPGWYVDFLSDIDLNSNEELQNLGIVIAFGVAFFIGYLIFTEFGPSATDKRAIVIFKRGSRPASVTSSDASDEEALKLEKAHAVEETEKPSATPFTVTDIFSWERIDYTVPISGGEERKLLSDISGYVAPGKLTALMGESGAGKTTLLNVLAHRVSVGVVSGDRFVNGQAIPVDFRSQTYVFFNRMNTASNFKGSMQWLLPAVGHS